MAKLTTEQRLKKIAFAGFVLAKNKRWQSPLSKATGVSQSMIALIMSGDRDLSPVIEERIGKGLISTAKKMPEHADRIEDMGHRILKTVEKPS
jgi:hypothetical protein